MSFVIRKLLIMGLVFSVLPLGAQAATVDDDVMARELSAALPVEKINECLTIQLYDEQRLQNAVDKAPSDKKERLQKSLKTQGWIKEIWIEALRIEVMSAGNSEDMEMIIEEATASVETIKARTDDSEFSDWIKATRGECTGLVMDLLKKE